MQQVLLSDDITCKPSSFITPLALRCRANVGKMIVDLIPLFSWGVVEPAMLLIAGSLPELRDIAAKGPPRARRPRRYDLEQFNYVHDIYNSSNIECQSSKDVECGQSESETNSDYGFARQQYAGAGQKTFTGQADYKHPGIAMDQK